MDVISALDVHAPPPELYHYSNQSGFLGIIKSSEIWASKIHYLNDSNEYQLALSLARDLLRSKLGQVEMSDWIKVECLLDNIRQIEQLNVCVVSLTEKRDLLSQWRAYGGCAGGVCLGFSSENLRKMASRQNFILARCIYSKEKQRELVAKLIEECLVKDFNTTKTRIDPINPRTIQVLATGGEFAEKLAVIAPMLKDSSFEEEGEWRLVSKSGISANAFDFRPGLSNLIPYYCFSLGKRDEYLKSVTIGPTPHKELAKGAVRLLAGKYGMGRSFEVFDTEIPFRNW